MYGVPLFELWKIETRNSFKPLGFAPLNNLPPWLLMHLRIQSSMKCIHKIIPYRNLNRALPEIGTTCFEINYSNTIYFTVSKNIDISKKINISELTGNIYIYIYINYKLYSILYQLDINFDNIDNKVQIIVNNTSHFTLINEYVEFMILSELFNEFMIHGTWGNYLRWSAK